MIKKKTTTESYLKLFNNGLGVDVARVAVLLERDNISELKELRTA